MGVFRQVFGEYREPTIIRVRELVRTSIDMCIKMCIMSYAV